ncbi:hypothetical protein C0J52_06086 [Blattella germanica]|nr:hypothetical protein C0J52_06086 [Blattella germanica]
MLKLNPYAAVLKRKAILTALQSKRKRDEILAKKRGITLTPTKHELKTQKTMERRREAIKKAKAAKPKKPKVTKDKKAAPAKVAKKPAPEKKAPAKKPVAKSEAKPASPAPAKPAAATPKK